MKDKIYSVIELLEHWQLKHGNRASYTFTIDPSGISRYKLSLYEYGEYKQLTNAYTLHTANIDEIIEKLHNGVTNQCAQ